MASVASCLIDKLAEKAATDLPSQAGPEICCCYAVRVPAMRLDFVGGFCNWCWGKEHPAAESMSPAAIDIRRKSLAVEDSAHVAGSHTAALAAEDCSAAGHRIAAAVETEGRWTIEE